MPEGDTIFRSARTLNRALAGRTVTGFATALPALQRVHDDHPLVGRTVVGARSVGKHLLIEFSGGLLLHTHMRMSGRWDLYRPGERWRRPPAAMRVVVTTDAFVAVAFDVPVAEWVSERDLARHAVLRALGPDLLGRPFDPTEAIRRLREHPGRGDRRRPARPAGSGRCRQRVQVRDSVCLWRSPLPSRGPHPGGARRADRARGPRSAARERRRTLPDVGGDGRRGAADDAAHGPGRPAVGLRPERTALPPMRDTHRMPEAGPGGAPDLLVPHVPAGRVRLNGRIRLELRWGLLHYAGERGSTGRGRQP